MAYDIRFNTSVAGADTLAQLDSLITKLSGNTKTASGNLQQFETLLRADVDAGKSLGESLKSIGAAAAGVFPNIAKIAKEAQGLVADSQRAAAETQKFGRVMELAYSENRARDLKKIEDALKAHARASAEAEAASNKTASGLLNLASGSGLVSGQVAGLTRSVGVLSGGLGGVATVGVIASAAIVAVGIVAVKAAYDLVKEFGEAQRETSNLADRLGLTVTQAEKLQAAARLTGVNISALEASARLLGEALENPATSGKKTSDALHKLGIETIGLKGELKETGPIVLELLDKLSKIPDQATRFALAQETLGRGSKVLQPLIADYAELQRAVAKLHVGEDAAGSAELLKADRAVKELDIHWELFKKHLAEAIAPIVIPVLTVLSGQEDAETSKARQDDRFVQMRAEGNKLPQHLIQGFIDRQIAPSLNAASSATVEGMAAQGRNAQKTSGASFRATDDKTKESLEEQLKTAKASVDKLRPDLRSDNIDAQTRATETAEYAKQSSEVDRLTKAIAALAEGKKAAVRDDSESIALQSRLDGLRRGELTGLAAINAEHDALIVKLREEDALYKKEHPNSKPNPKLTERSRDLADQIRDEETRRYNQQLDLSGVQNARGVSNSVYEQIRRVDAAQRTGGAEIALARGRQTGEDESAINTAYDSKLKTSGDEFEDAARHVQQMRAESAERESIQHDEKALDKELADIRIAEIKASGDAALALYEAQKQKEIELAGLQHKRYEDAASEAKNVREITDAGTHADIEDRKAGLSRQSKLISAGSDGPGNELTVLRQQIELRRQAAQLDRDEKQHDIDGQRQVQQQLLQDNPAQKKEVDAALASLRVQEIENVRGYEREIGDERLDIEVKIAEIRKKSLDEFRTLIGGLFEAVANRQPRALPNFVKSQVLGQAQKLTENAAATYLWPTVSTISKSVGQSGPLFAGTWFGGGATAKEDPLKITAAPALVSAAGDLTAAAHVLAAARGGAIPGGGLTGGAFSDGAGGVPTYTDSTPVNATYDDSGNIVPGGVDGLPGIINNPAVTSPVAANSPLALLAKLAGGGGFTTGLTSVASGNALSTLLGSGDSPAAERNYLNTGSDTVPLSSQIGAGVGIAGAAAAGAYGIYSGIKQGGVGGDLKAAGSAAGLAGGIVGNVSKLLQASGPLLNAIPIIGSIAALALPLIGGLFNNPQKRANDISNELQSNQYLAPTALNVTQSTNGTLGSFDARGNYRTTNLSAVPTVSEPSIYTQTHGIFGGPPTYYDIPGRDISPYSGTVTGSGTAPVAGGPSGDIHITINAIDSQSMKEALTRNHGAVGAALVAHLYSGDTATHSALKFSIAGAR